MSNLSTSRWTVAVGLVTLVAWSIGLAWLAVTLPLYYLRFPLAAMGHAAWFDYGILWLEFVPVWLLLAWELRRSIRTTSQRPTQETPLCIAPSALP